MTNRVTPQPMYFNYGGKNYRFEGGDVIYEDVNHDGQIDELDIVYSRFFEPEVQWWFRYRLPLRSVVTENELQLPRG